MAIQKLSPFRLWTLQNFPFIAEDFDALTTYELLCKIVEYLNNVIDVTNNQSSAINELENLYNELKEYVDNYFENLDIQTEIDNKLDEMAESGQLEEIIGEYINSNALLTYNTLADLKSAQNLINGSKVRILGYRAVNDGGASDYYVREVTNQDTENDMDIVALYDTNLVAEFMPSDDKLNVKQFGAYGDNTHDDTDVFEFALTYSNTNNLKLFVPSGTYIITSALEIDNNIIGNNATLSFSEVAQSFYVGADTTFNLKDIKIVTSGHGVQINNVNNVNSVIDGCNIISEDYGILVNTNTDGGKNLKITNNNIFAKSDAIEINTTSSEDDKFTNVIIDNNILETDSTASATTSGFAVGIATGKNIIVSNNIVNESRYEAVHIEDGSESIIVSNNVFNNCNNDGVRLYCNESKNKIVPNVTNNIINGKTKNDNYAIYNANTVNGSYVNLNISNNTINNFDTVLFNQALTSINADGLQVKNCNQFTKNLKAREIHGNINLNEVPFGSVANSEYPLVIDSLTFTTLPDNWLTVAENEQVVIRSLSFNKRLTVSTQQSYQTIPLMKIPKYMNCNVDICVYYDSYYTKATSTSVLASNGTITNTSNHSIDYGSISGASALKVVDGYLCAYVYAPNVTANKRLNVRVSFNGEMYFTNYNN